MHRAIHDQPETNKPPTPSKRPWTNFQIETPSWGYADTGTRFGKFTQDGAGHHH